MKSDAKLPRLLLVSPWFLLIFLVVPIIVILSLTLHLDIPLAGPWPLLVNNICFALLVACRLFRYLAGTGKGIRYGAGWRRPRRSAVISRSVSDVHDLLSGAGYFLDADGDYGEKRDLGYFGTTIVYGGLLILLATGCWDNLRQFSGVLLDGVGPATRLSRLESYRRLTKGPLAAKPDALPRMEIIKQFLPDRTFPRGATEVVLMPEDGKELRTVLKPTEPVSYGPYDIYMTKLVFEPELVIKSKDSRVLFDGFVRLDPLVQKRGDFSFYGLFMGAQVVGGVYYQPEKSLLMVVITRDDKRVVADMTFQVDQQVEKEGYILSCAKMGEWSEIHVVYRRHKGLLLLGGVIAFMGLVLRLAIPTERIWLEGADGGCRVTAVGKETLKLLKIEG